MRPRWPGRPRPRHQTQAIECSGSWDALQETMKTKLGDKFEEIKVVRLMI